MNKVYLDYAATTPIDPRVLEKMNSVAKEQIGNPSSVHAFGREAARVLDGARESVAKDLNADFSEIIFTSGATESNNLAILGVLKRFREKYPDRIFHMITTNIEHSSVLEVFKYIESNRLAEVTFIECDEGGLVSDKQVKAAIKENTILVSVMYANNEIGTIQPIRNIGKLIKKVNEKREREIMNRKSAGEELAFDIFSKVYLHTDAVQAANYFDLDVQKLHVDMLTLSAHKFYGPKGVGVLFVKQGTPLSQITYGGEQELHLRPGTYNLPGIVGCAEALKKATGDWRLATGAMEKMRDDLIMQLEKLGGIINGDKKHRLPNNVNVSFPGKSGETLMLQLDQRGIAVSTGSACASGSVEPSHVLQAITSDPDRCNSSLRITLSKQTTQDEIDALLTILKDILS